MKYFKTQNLYKASNVTLDPVKLDARSYHWWRFLKPIGTNLVFNNYRYSVTTAGHQRRVLETLESIGIKRDSLVIVHSPKSLDDSSWVESCISIYEMEKIKLLEETKKPRSQLRRNSIRIQRANELTKKIKLIKQLGGSNAAR